MLLATVKSLLQGNRERNLNTDRRQSTKDLDAARCGFNEGLFMNDTPQLWMD